MPTLESRSLLSPRSSRYVPGCDTLSLLVDRRPRPFCPPGVDTADRRFASWQGRSERPSTRLRPHPESHSLGGVPGPRTRLLGPWGAAGNIPSAVQLATEVYRLHSRVAPFCMLRGE